MAFCPKTIPQHLTTQSNPQKPRPQNHPLACYTRTLNGLPHRLLQHGRRNIPTLPLRTLLPHARKEPRLSLLLRKTLLPPRHQHPPLQTPLPLLPPPRNLHVLNAPPRRSRRKFHQASLPTRPARSSRSHRRSIWEIETLQNHYHPNVATLAGIISDQFTKQSYTLEDFLDHSYASVRDFCISLVRGFL